MNKAIRKLLKAAPDDNSILLTGLEQALDSMERSLEEVCICRCPELEENLKRIITSGGKRLRPTLVYLGYTAGKEDPERQDSDYPAVPLMMAVELIHTSSLIHDDIVDMAAVRRSVPTISAVSGSRMAVQAGDFLLAKAAGTLKYYPGLQLEQRFAKVAKEMCLAEFHQMEREYVFDPDSLEHYFLQIRRKTAAFISGCTAVGAKAGGASQKTAEALEAYGLHAGIAFQIRDDVLDFVPGENFGKKCGQDAARGIFTLPLILALRQNECVEERDAAEAVAVKAGKTEEELRMLLEYVKTSGAIELAQKEIEHYTELAVADLAPLADSEVKEALANLADALAVRSI